LNSSRIKSECKFKRNFLPLFSLRNEVIRLDEMPDGASQVADDFIMKAGAVYKQEIRYDAKAEVFVGKRVRTADTFEKR